MNPDWALESGNVFGPSFVVYDSMNPAWALEFGNVLGPSFVAYEPDCNQLFEGLWFKGLLT